MVVSGLLPFLSKPPYHLSMRGPPAMARVSIHSWREHADDQIVPSAVEFFQSSPHRGDVRHTIEADWSGDEVRARAFVRGFIHQNSLTRALHFSNALQWHANFSRSTSWRRHGTVKVKGMVVPHGSCHFLAHSPPPRRGEL